MFDFKKSVTTIATDGAVSVEQQGIVASADLNRDMEEELRRIRDVVESGRGRIQSVEETRTTLIVIYVYGAVRVYHWVAE